MAATAEELTAVPGIGPELAVVIVDKLRAVEETTTETGKKRLVLRPISPR
jgi:DNA uptake protein ComE-like DNA-binding protein